MVAAAMASAIPAVPGLPLVGSLFTARRNRLDLWMLVRDTCGDIGQVRMGNRALVLVSSPELIHAVLVEYADRLATILP